MAKCTGKLFLRWRILYLTENGIRSYEEDATPKLLLAVVMVGSFRWLKGRGAVSQRND
jgi:hypothetical protein